MLKIAHRHTPIQLTAVHKKAVAQAVRATLQAFYYVLHRMMVRAGCILIWPERSKNQQHQCGLPAQQLWV
jgi:hypothetical protein